MLHELLTNTASLRLMSFLTLHRDSSFYDKEISEQTGLSRGTTNRLLNQFLDFGLVFRERKGRMWFYTLNQAPLVNSFRVFENLVMLSELVASLCPLSRRIILFGSAATGEDTAASDIDLFIISQRKDEALAAIRDFQTDREIKPVIQTALEYADGRAKDKAFFEQVEKGLKLFEGEGDEQGLSEVHQE